MLVKSLFVVCALGVVCVYATQIGTIVNVSPDVNFDIALEELGHTCYNYNVGLMSQEYWTTGSDHYCLVNVDRIIFSVTGNPGINCTAEIHGVYQRDYIRHEDILDAVSVAVGTDGIGICMNVATSSVGGSSGVTATSTCASCQKIVENEPFQAGEYINVANANIEVNLYTESGACYSSSISQDGDRWSYIAAQGHYCATPLTMISFSSGSLGACNVSYSTTASSSSSSGILGIAGASICLTQAVTSSGDVVNSSQTCPQCYVL